MFSSCPLSPYLTAQTRGLDVEITGTKRRERLVPGILNLMPYHKKYSILLMNG
jgi:hypothetical protein